MQILENPQSFLLFLIVIIILGIISLKKRILNVKGTICALIVGLIIYIFGGPFLFIALLTFYLLGSLSTRYRLKDKTSFNITSITRSWKNVIANGLIPSLLSVFEYMYKSDIIVVGFLGSIAFSTADTLASEIGILSSSNPRLLIGFQKVNPGTPGAVSVKGIIASFLGSAFIASLIFFIKIDVTAILIILFSGFLGSFIDSLLGASLQAKYLCAKCGFIIEENFHCGERALKISGYESFNTHIVNLLSSVITSIIAMLFYMTAMNIIVFP